MHASMPTLRLLLPALALCLLTARAAAQEAVVGSTVAVPEGRRTVDAWPVARGAWLSLVAWPRGTPAPLELYLGRGRPDSTRAPLDLPRPLALRAEHAAARAWAAAVVGMYAPGDTSRFAAGPRATALEGSTAGAGLELVPVPGTAGVPDSVRLRLTSDGPPAELRLSAAEGWSIAWHVGELANVLDPEGMADYGRVHVNSQVDRPPATARRLCEPRHPITPEPGKKRPPKDAPEFGAVLVRFVIDTMGRVEPASLVVVRLEGGAAFAESVRNAVPCLRYRPAELRGRRVRVLAQQSFRFRTED